MAPTIERIGSGCACNLMRVLIRLTAPKRELLERPDNPTDKRTKLAKITLAGRQLVEKVKPGMVKAQTRLIDPLTDEEYALYMALTQKLISANDHSSRAPWRPNQQPSKKKLATSDG